MRVTVSIPDEVFKETELLAKQLGISRSEIHCRALTRFLRHNSPDHITELLNKVVDAVGEAHADSFGKRAARRILRRVESGTR